MGRVKEAWFGLDMDEPSVAELEIDMLRGERDSLVEYAARLESSPAVLAAFEDTLVSIHLRISLLDVRIARAEAEYLASYPALAVGRRTMF